MVDLGELSIAVESEGADEAADKVQQATEGDGGGGLLSGVSGPGGGKGGGGALGQLMSTLGGMSSAMTGILGAVGLIAALLASLKPIQKMIGALFKVIQAFVMPLAVMLMRLLSPVLGFLLRLLPIWMDFLSDPKGMIQDAISWLESMLQKKLDDLLDAIPGINRGNGEGFGGITGDPSTSITDYGGLLGYGWHELTNGDDDTGGMDGRNETNIILEGGWGTFLESATEQEEFSWGRGP